MGVDTWIIHGQEDTAAKKEPSETSTPLTR